MMRYYSTIKMNKVLTHSTPWMDLENMVRWKKPDTKGHIFQDSTCVKLIQTESRFEILRGWGKREEGSCCLMIKEFPSGVMKKLWKYTGVTLYNIENAAELHGENGKCYVTLYFTILNNYNPTHSRATAPEFVILVWEGDLRICISNQLPGDNWCSWHGDHILKSLPRVHNEAEQPFNFSCFALLIV